MKQKIHFKLIVLLLMPTLVIANNNIPFLKKESKERTIEKTYQVNADATVKISNAYGNIDIITWDKNTVEFDVVIKVTGNNQDKVDERFDGIDVEFSATESMVTAKTIISKNKSNWWNWGKKMKLKLEINYVVKVPMSNNVDLSNDYGYITVDKLEGRAKISCDYGKITTKELLSDNNDINFDYSKGCYFEFINSGNINADYSSYTIAKAKNLNVNADYSKSVIEIAENVNYNCDYNSLEIEKANNVNGKGDYLSLRLGDIYKNVQIKADYGSIKIDRMTDTAENINIKSDYAGITIGIDPNYNFDFEINLGYGSLRDTEDFSFTKKRIESSDKYYLGYHGASNSGHNVKIESEYGSVSFKKQ